MNQNKSQDEKEYFCSECNTQVQLSDKVCPKCGESLEETVQDSNVNNIGGTSPKDKTSINLSTVPSESKKGVEVSKTSKQGTNYDWTFFVSCIIVGVIYAMITGRFPGFVQGCFLVIPVLLVQSLLKALIGKN